ncbi:hypothetical protein F5Y16DRAFT_423279 [Xylariaceae sp. FL0255]|nr:hypothetical protein F5Y16DRAFT_423279 [Xylariaceae sp. FL0255]
MYISRAPCVFLTLAAEAEAVTTVIPTTRFDSQAEFDASWIYNYPWGTDHNGRARMNQSQVQFSNGLLTLTAKKVSGQPDASSGGKENPINYISGTISAKNHFTVSSQGGGYDFSGKFKRRQRKVLGRRFG